MQQADATATPFHGILDLKGVDIAGFQKFLQPPALTNADGVLSGHTNIASESGKLSAQGQMTVDKLRVRGVDVGYPVTADYEVNEDLTSDLLRINKGTVKLGQTPLEAKPATRRSTRTSAHLPSKTEPPWWNGSGPGRA